ncbi:beta-ketoacyl-[acyl-carrier-protein] synthase II [Streptomyces agglomeratus]|uniref:beta-ketoacyl-ACP synthase II n=1 Tax=Streptomyces agglomeratus TaxID=285458 RepID=UPI00086B0E3C|nr:beta-ketoacyl-ACP synthase II [Streptomyces agglomeratus]OEJ57813.1 beta-ketoacyl-[acyl-carrier-protein] synthase II [Streptomyces agglomeratus]
MNGRQVVITGIGPVTPIGVGAHDFWQAQLKGVSGVRRISRFDPDGLPVRIAGEVDLPERFTPGRREALASDRCTQLGLAAARLALEDSSLDLTAEDRDRVGVVMGTGAGGALTWETNTRALVSGGPSRIGARSIAMSMANGTASRIALDHGITGPSTAVVTACASGAEALIGACQMIVSGEADVVLAGGSEAPVTPLIVGGFARIRALSTRNDEPERASRPFSEDRDGFVLAEGAAVLVLESLEHARARGATVLATLSGYGRSSDAHHVTAPHPEGAGAARAMRAALRSAGWSARDVSYVNAHGTGTSYNDASEARALRTALGEEAGRTPVSSTKSMTGHSLGAAGAVEAVVCVQALTHGVVPPTVNLDRADPDLGLDVVGADAREIPLGAVLSNSFAFGGHNVVLAFGAPR